MYSISFDCTNTYARYVEEKKPQSHDRDTGMIHDLDIFISMMLWNKQKHSSRSIFFSSQNCCCRGWKTREIWVREKTQKLIFWRQSTCVIVRWNKNIIFRVLVIIRLKKSKFTDNSWLTRRVSVNEKFHFFCFSGSSEFPHIFFPTSSSSHVEILIEI